MNINYEKTAFVLIKPPSKVVSTHKINNRHEHIKLIETAKHNELLLYYSHVIKKGNKYYTDQPLIVDEESAKNYIDMFSDNTEKEDSVEVQPSVQVAPPITEERSLVCPFCNKKMSSTPGRTLHIKSKHPDKLDEYKGML